MPVASREVIFVDRLAGFVTLGPQAPYRHGQFRVHHAGQAAGLQEQQLVFLAILREHGHITGGHVHNIGADIENSPGRHLEVLAGLDLLRPLQQGP